MRIDAVRFVSFRNLADAEIGLQGKDVFLVGENGQGKTNFLEALYFCSYASSFRGVTDKELAAYHKKSFSVCMRFSGALYQETLVKFEEGKKNILLDGKRAEDRKQLLYLVPTIVFCPEDMSFISGPPERRRWFFDQNLSLYDPLYLEDLRKYKKILKTRNAILKDCKEKRKALSPAINIAPMLDALDPQLAAYGLRIIGKRKYEARMFSEVFTALYETVCGIGGIQVDYRPSWKEESEKVLLEKIDSRRETDILFGSTMTGPHHDRYIFTRGGINFVETASTGQRRILALLLRVGQATRFREQTEKDPVLLLDDVLLELDGEKKKRFLAAMPNYGQAFYTFLPEEPFERYLKSDTQVYDVAGGVIHARS